MDIKLSMPLVTSTFFLLFSVLFSYSTGTVAGEVSQPSLEITAVIARATPEPDTIDVIGTVVPYKTVSVRSRIDSQITGVYFKDGDNVKQGDILFKLDDRMLVAQQKQEEAAIARDRVDIENFRQKYSRDKKLIAQKAVSDQDLDDAKTALDAAQASLDADQAQLEATNVQIGYATITAPIEGRIGFVKVNIGNTVQASESTPLAVINQIEPIYIEASLPQDTILKARAGLLSTQKITVIASAMNKGIVENGQLASVDNMISQDTGTYTARAIFENTDEKLWPGMMVSLSIQMPDKRSVVAVPEQAIQHAPDGDYVFVIRDGKAAQTKVHTEMEKKGIAYINTGLKAGTSVAINGFMSLEDGSPVETTVIDQFPTADKTP